MHVYWNDLTKYLYVTQFLFLCHYRFSIGLLGGQNEKVEIRNENVLVMQRKLTLQKGQITFSICNSITKTLILVEIRSPKFKVDCLCIGRV